MKKLVILMILFCGLIACSSSDDESSGGAAPAGPGVMYKPFEAADNVVFSLGDINNPYLLKLTNVPISDGYKFRLAVSQGGYSKTFEGGFTLYNGEYYVPMSMLIEDFALSLTADQNISFSLEVLDTAMVSTFSWNNGSGNIQVKNKGELYNWRDIFNMGLQCDGNYALKKDIDLAVSGYPTQVSFKESCVESAFIGTFDGENRKLSNLAITATDRNNVGLFAKAKNATIRNLTIEGANIEGHNAVGILVGTVAEKITLANLNIAGSVNSSKKGVGIGGIVGAIIGSADIDSVVFGNASSVNGGSAVGGIVGSVIGSAGSTFALTISKSLVSDSDITAKPTDYGYAGGLIGEVTKLHSLSIDDTYSLKNRISGNMAVSGLIGNVSVIDIDLTSVYVALESITPNNSPIVIQGLTNDSSVSTFSGVLYQEITPGAENVGIEELDPMGVSRQTSAEMKSQDTYQEQSYDFTTTWEHQDGQNGSYPFLK